VPRPVEVKSLGTVRPTTTVSDCPCAQRSGWSFVWQLSSLWQVFYEHEYIKRSEPKSLEGLSPQYRILLS